MTVRRSITPDAILCMECGKSLKSLKRHLRTDHDLSPESYRSKWGLPKTYPMVAATYSAARSALAKSIGLGFRGTLGAGDTATAAASAPAAPEVPEAPPATKPRARTGAVAEPKASAAKPKRLRAAKPAAAN